MALLTIRRHQEKLERAFDPDDFLGDVFESFVPPEVTTITVVRTDPKRPSIPLPGTKRCTPFDVRTRPLSYRSILPVQGESGSESSQSSPISSSLSIPPSTCSSNTTESDTAELQRCVFPDTSELFVFRVHDEDSRDSQDSQDSQESDRAQEPVEPVQPMSAIQCITAKNTLSMHPSKVKRKGSRPPRPLKIEKTTELRRSQRFGMRLRLLKKK